MSYGSWPVGDTNAVKLWAKDLAVAERESLEIEPLIGDDEDSIIHRKKELEKGKGDKITFNLRARPTQKGIGSSQRAEGNSENMTVYADALYIEELGCNFGARSEYSIEQQRVPWNLREECKNLNKEWWIDRKSKTFFNHVCGYTPANVDAADSGPFFTGLNTVTAPAGVNRQIWAGTAGNDQSLGNSDTMSLALIDKAVTAASLGNSMVAPLMVGGQKKYVMYLHPVQVEQLRTAAGTSANTWQNIMNFAYSGLNVSKNPIYTGALGEYNGVILRKSQDVTLGVHSSSGASQANVRRAVLLGRQACAIGYGQKYTGNNRYRWSEKLLDHDRLLEVSSWLIWGMKKCVFNGTDHGTVVVSTYSAL
jgi:N4-gp56 family major capsid protein